MREGAGSVTKTGRTRQKQRAATPVKPGGVETLLKRARKRRGLRDGALELATAIASMSEAVRLDLSREPFVTEPVNLFDLTFGEAGIGEEQMPLLREQLKALLPEIAEELDSNGQVLDQAGHRIESYAAFVRIALLMKVR
ncbi:MAG: hypothetical protein ABI972_24675 [Acidobacteriota bacterium]